MENKPLVSIIVPTYNSEKTLARCLKSVKSQTYGNIEVIVVDSFSTDGTVEISRKFGANFIQTSWRTLGARYTGLKNSRGSFILMLDSDQILRNKYLIEKCVKLMEMYDMLILEEFGYKPTSWVQKACEACRRDLIRFSKYDVDPLNGWLIPRFYKREILEKAFENIPRELLPIGIFAEDVITYYESRKISQRVGFVPNAIWHIDPSSLAILIRKSKRYGRSLRESIELEYYRKILKMKLKSTLRLSKIPPRMYLSLLALVCGSFLWGYLTEDIKRHLLKK